MSLVRPSYVSKSTVGPTESRGWVPAGREVPCYVDIEFHGRWVGPPHDLQYNMLGWALHWDGGNHDFHLTFIIMMINQKVIQLTFYNSILCNKYFQLSRFLDIYHYSFW